MKRRFCAAGALRSADQRDQADMSVTSTVVDRAETRFVEAAAPLRPYVGCFWVITAERGARIQIVPDGSTSISIELRNDRSSGWCLRGPLVRPDVRRFASPATLVGVRLRPGVALSDQRGSRPRDGGPTDQARRPSISRAR